MKLKVLVFSLIFLSTLLYSQSVIWEENFNPAPSDWTLDQNWFFDDALILNWSPTIVQFDLHLKR